MSLICTILIRVIEPELSTKISAIGAESDRTLGLPVALLLFCNDRLGVDDPLSERSGSLSPGVMAAAAISGVAVIADLNERSGQRLRAAQTAKAEVRAGRGRKSQKHFFMASTIGGSADIFGRVSTRQL